MTFLQNKKFFILLLLHMAIAINAKPLKVHSKTFHLEKVCDSLPESVKESSGLLLYNNQYWTFNDSGNDACIYALDKQNHEVIQRICIKNAQNIDWEAICADSNFIYLGDIGNNFGSRSLLNIYRLKKVDIPKKGNAEVFADVISFSYKNFKAPKTKEYSEFDAEAMICVNDTLLIFSKNWKKPFCEIYKIPASPGHYEIVPFSQFCIDGQVTDATYHSLSSSLVLIGYAEYVPFILYFKKFEHSNCKYKSKKRKNYPTKYGLQLEASCFIDEGTIIVGSEYNVYTPGSLFKVDLYEENVNNK